MVLTAALHGVVFTNCTFTNITIEKLTEGCTFRLCTFQKVSFAGLRDTSFQKCTLKKVTLRKNAVDVHFDQCAFTALSSVNQRWSRVDWKHCTNDSWASHRDTLSQCTWDNCTFKKGTILNTTVSDSSLTNTQLHHLTWSKGVWARVQWKQCLWADCTATDAKLSGNQLHGVTRKRCNFSHSMTLSCEWYECKTSTCIFSHSKWRDCKWLSDEQLKNQYDHNRWMECDIIDAKWRDIQLDHSHCNAFHWQNVKEHNVFKKNTIFVNCSRAQAPPLYGQVHCFEDGKDTPLEIGFYSHNYPMFNTLKHHWKIRPSMAKEIDFIFIRCAPAWFTFGFSTPPNVRHLVQYVSFGDHIQFYPTTTEYTDAVTGNTLVGYHRVRQRPRAHSV